MAQWAHKNKIPVIYYILPQIWAWNERRIKYIEKYTQTRLAILPFEKSYYQNKNLFVHYVGHPLVEHIENFKKLNAEVLTNNKNNSELKTIIALLPGSRIQEIKKHVNHFAQAHTCLRCVCVCLYMLKRVSFKQTFLV